LKDTCTFGQADGAINISAPLEHPSTSPWFVFDPYKDFERMGLGKMNENWRISTINQTYELIPTYPSLLGVPSKISDNTLRHIAKFRSKGRIPSLSYLHTNKVLLI
jgi:myotubularin-related protein 6/7/8